MVTCYLGIGSNLGDRRKNISFAIKKIGALEKTKVIKASRIIETKPVGGPRKQGNFLNTVLKIRSDILPLTLHKKLQKIEKELGRTKAVRNGPRTIDLDILLYGDRIIKSKDLRVPHPKMLERGFVLRPLYELIC